MKPPTGAGIIGQVGAKPGGSVAGSVLPPRPELTDPRVAISPGVEKCGPDVRGIALFIPLIAAFVAFAIVAVGFALGLLASRML